MEISRSQVEPPGALPPAKTPPASGVPTLGVVAQPSVANLWRWLIGIIFRTIRGALHHPGPGLCYDLTHRVTYVTYMPIGRLSSAWRHTAIRCEHTRMTAHWRPRQHCITICSDVHHTMYVWLWRHNLASSMQQKLQPSTVGGSSSYNHFKSRSRLNGAGSAFELSPIGIDIPGGRRPAPLNCTRMLRSWRVTVSYLATPMSVQDQADARDPTGGNTRWGAASWGIRRY